MAHAEELAKRSTCARLQVGSVITTGDLTPGPRDRLQRNARGLPNRCDSTEPGSCGCLHSEQNCLIKAGAQIPQGHVRQCLALRDVRQDDHQHQRHARLLQRAYRDPAGLDVLRQGGVEVIHYEQWRDLCVTI